MSPSVTNIQNSKKSDVVLTKSIEDFIQSNIQEETEAGTSANTNRAFEYTLTGSCTYSTYQHSFLSLLCVVSILALNLTGGPLWLFCLLLIVAFIEWVACIFSVITKIRFRIVSGTITIEFFDLFHNSLHGEDFDMRELYDTILIKKIGNRKRVLLVRNDSYLEKLKKGRMLSSCFIGKQYLLPLKDFTQFRNDFRI